MLDLEKTFSTYFKSIESGITKLKSGLDDISNRISNMAVELALFRSNFNAYRSDVAGYVNNIISRNINPLLWGEYKVYNVRICV